MYVNIYIDTRSKVKQYRQQVTENMSWNHFFISYLFVITWFTLSCFIEIHYVYMYITPVLFHVCVHTLEGWEIVIFLISATHTGRVLLTSYSNTFTCLNNLILNYWHISYIAIVIFTIYIKYTQKLMKFMIRKTW